MARLLFISGTVRYIVLMLGQNGVSVTCFVVQSIGLYRNVEKNTASMLMNTQATSSTSKLCVPLEQAINTGCHLR